MRVDRTYQEWIAIRERYYNGDTTQGEERDFADFVLNAPEAQIPEFDADRAVFAYLITGKTVHQSASRQHNRWTAWYAAASVVILLVAGHFLWMDQRSDCMMSIDGQQYYAEDLVAQQMDRNLSMVLADFTTVEDELSVMFSD